MRNSSLLCILTLDRRNDLKNNGRTVCPITGTVVFLALLVAAAVAASGQTITYYYTNFVGMPGGSGNADGTGSAARFR